MSHSRWTRLSKYFLNSFQCLFQLQALVMVRLTRELANDLTVICTNRSTLTSLTFSGFILFLVRHKLISFLLDKVLCPKAGHARFRKWKFGVNCCQGKLCSQIARNPVKKRTRIRIYFIWLFRRDIVVRIKGQNVIKYIFSVLKSYMNTGPPKVSKWRCLRLGGEVMESFAIT